MYFVIDLNRSSDIDFKEFMIYINMLLNGSKLEKQHFIFRMICPRQGNQFKFKDLVRFYEMVNRQEAQAPPRTAPLGAEFSSISELLCEEEEMAALVFELMRLEKDRAVNFQQFRRFLSEDKSHEDLFNFIPGADCEERSKIKIRRSLGSLVNAVKQLQADLLAFESCFVSSFLAQQRPVRPRDQKMWGRNTFNLKFLKVINQKSSRDSLLEPRPRGEEKENFFRTAKTPLQRRSRLPRNRSNSIYQGFSKYAHQARSRSSFHTSGGRGQKYFLNLIDSLITRSITIQKLLERELSNVEKSGRLGLELRKSASRGRGKGVRGRRVFLTDPNWNLATSMVQGISKSLQIVSQDRYHLLTAQDFRFKNKIEMESVYKTNFTKCKFKDYAPHVFQSLRKESGISDEAYIRSIGVDTFKNAFFDQLYLMLSENSSGKSGSFFFHTSDRRFMIKTIHDAEFHKLLDTLPRYHRYVINHPSHLLTKYFGLHQIKCFNKDRQVYKFNIVVMNNFLNSPAPLPPTHLYDLKGSLYHRATSPRDAELGLAKKDLNFLQDKAKVVVSPQDKAFLVNQLHSDSRFLASIGVLDYSLLLGTLKNPGGHQDRPNRFLSPDRQEVYYLGIIDTLTDFNARKKGEYLLKKVFQGDGVSCVPPEQYQERFMRMMDFIIWD